MTAHLQNPDNWPGVMRAARELKGKLPELEREVGIRAAIGPVEAISRENASQTLNERLPEEAISEEAIYAELDEIFDRIAPRTVEPSVQHDFRRPELRVPDAVIPLYVGEKVSLAERDRLEQILTDANDAPQAKKDGTLRWLGRSLLKRFGLMALLAGAPIPQMQLQHCQISRQGSLAQITCDSRDVCPPGFVLETTWDGDWPDRGDQLMKVMGYGPDVENTCARPEGYGRKVNQLIP